MKKTKNSIFTSAIALLLCVAMLVGTTYAWFTDSAVSSGNVVATGKLDVELHWSDKLLASDSDEWIDGTQNAVFTHNNWEPGYTEIRYIKVSNAGTLNLKWKLTIEADGPVTALADVIDVYYVNPVAGEITTLDGLSSVGKISEVMAEKTNSTGRLTPGQSAILAIAFHLDETAGNEYQGMSLCDNGFSLKLLATQDIGESDSFGDNYDEDADWDEGSVNFTASAALSEVPLIHGTLASNVTIGDASGISAYLPSGVKVAEGATSLDLAINKVDPDNIIIGEGTAATSLDVHVSGIAADNTVPMIVNLGAILPAGMDDTELKLYHTEDGTPVLMTRVAGADDFAIHNQYTYNAATGEVSIFVASFSVFSAVQANVDKWDGTSDTSWYNENDTEFTLTTAEQFAGFRDLVDGGNTFEGKTVKLGVDVDLDGKLFDPIGYGYAHLDGQVFMGTFDGSGYTVYKLYQNGWELDSEKYTYSTAGGGLFASIKDATIKNLAVSGANIVFECIDIGIVVGYAQGQCHFENIVVTNSKIANYNRATGGVVGEVCYGSYGTDVSKGYSHTFKNVVVDSSVKISSLWGSFDTLCGGVIGGKWGDATVKMEDVIVAAELDVFSDVTSAYRWYAYRRAGMLIGHTEQNSPKKALNAAAEFLTCERVNVYYGDWVNYTYYEFANQDSATGQRYPWVRAEAGEHNAAFSNPRYGVPTHGGEKVTDGTNSTASANITFGQLYGGGQGVYGCNEHAGVTISDKTAKTIYIENNLGWENLKLQYWFNNGEDTWTTLINGIALVGENNIYKIDLPAYAHGFKITADSDNTTRAFYAVEVTEGETYFLDFAHIHSFINTKCVCGAYQQLAEYVFTFGENGSASHKDGSSSKTNYSETVNGVTLSIENGTNMYPDSYDAKGNSCIKLGASSKTGSFSFAVPNDVTSVVIYVAGYKDADGYVIINDTNYTVNSLSNNGEYTAIEIDTTSSKTINFATANKADDRCMIDTIIFVVGKTIEVHECNTNTVIESKSATCTETGLSEGAKCDVCGAITREQEILPSTGHTPITDAAVAPKCNATGLTEGSHCDVCEEIIVAQEILDEVGHSFVDDKCEWCGALNHEHTYEKAVTDPNCTENGYTTYTCDCGDSYIADETDATGHNYVDYVCSTCGHSMKNTYTFSGYAEGTQYADNEEHVLDEYTTVVTTDCHFTSELRIYSSSTNNGYVIIKSTNLIKAIGVNAGNKVDELIIYGSNDDGETWTEVARISVTSTSYNDYTAELVYAYKWLKLDVEGTNQVRLKSITLSTVPDCKHTTTTEKAVDPTCTEAGHTDTKCVDCGIVIETVEGDPATGHLNTTTTTVDATCTEAGSTTVTCDDCKAVVSTEETSALGHTTENGTCDNCGEEIGGNSDPTLTEKTYSYTFTGKQFSANGTKTLGGVEWTLAGDGGYWGYDGTKGQQFGSGNKPYRSLTLTSASFNNVSKIVINTSGANDINATFTVTVNGVQVGSSTKITSTATEYIFELDEPVTGEIVITYTQTSSKAIYVKSITVDYAE